MKKGILALALVSGLIVSCYFPDRAGNLKILNYQIQTNLKLSLVKSYIDSLSRQKNYAIPEKWKYEIKQSDLDTLRNVRLYFKEDKNNPEEMYLISFIGYLALADVFRKDHWVAVPQDMSEEEETRVIKRFRSQILDSVEVMAKHDGVPDSLLYRHR